ncbi:hypothetical protein TGARI_284610 [Toxoplasma gondii ARI]|uniref:Uncharacterized protein n=1 Tax=Toxoplasma gondii ARI TaxID=1074872 RepID=A0A139XYQ8_TOXGO|nr:hypothetical protein TGARI_284610 [Toxoplasma gondii ARI]
MTVPSEVKTGTSMTTNASYSNNPYLAGCHSYKTPNNPTAAAASIASSNTANMTTACNTFSYPTKPQSVGPGSTSGLHPSSSSDRRRSSFGSQKLTGVLATVRRTSNSVLQTLTGRGDWEPASIFSKGEPSSAAARRCSRRSETEKGDRLSFSRSVLPRGSNASASSTNGWGLSGTSSAKPWGFRRPSVTRNGARGSSVSGPAPSRTSRFSTEGEPEEYSIYFGGQNEPLAQPLQTLEIFGAASKRAEELRAQRGVDEVTSEREGSASLRSILVVRSSQGGLYGAGSTRPPSRSIQNRVRFTEVNELREYNPHETFRRRGSRAESEHPLLTSLRNIIFRTRSDKRAVEQLAEKVQMMTERTSAVAAVMDSCVNSFEREAETVFSKESLEETQMRVADAHKQCQAEILREDRNTKCRTWRRRSVPSRS